MKKYEMMIVFDNEGTPVEESKTFVKETFSANTITIVDEKDIGVKELAYEIEGKRRGFYYLLHLEANPKVLIEINKTFKLYKGILRFLTINEEK